MLTLSIINGTKRYYPMVQDGMTWTTERHSAPGTLKFSVLYDRNLKMEEGNVVQLMEDDTGIFFGFIFKMEMSKDKVISVTAYDQLRYFKNKNNYVYTNLSTSELVKRMASDFKLQTGTIADTVYRMSRCESESTLFDIFNNSNEETLRVMKETYVLYDDFGKLCLKNISELKTGILIYDQTAEEYTYTSSIDENTYNRIKLTYDNKETGVREVYIAQDSSTISQWGVLQYLETVDDPAKAKTKLNALLSLYNTKTKTLKVKNCLGDIRVRGGTMVLVVLDFWDQALSNFMLVESAQHTFSSEGHRMNLTLRGGEINGT